MKSPYIVITSRGQVVCRSESESSAIAEADRLARTKDGLGETYAVYKQVCSTHYKEPLPQPLEGGTTYYEDHPTS